ncbi:apicoplast calcium binding protein 1, putative (ACBP1) [Plasmodium ovale wallikeri]|uniref:Apicoplast calcium binding protein 1, putative n=2 Tax=Plasmodium ovale TaxID=36330 RepID=A0A1C3KID0_PLAOA|nr:apicoplast calcium binding protein 1, putative (ACBP1) [Plasmodium ovale wallikeri]SBT41403.1 apicoplast calcium binding protein 1, putative (ACBP1) [Plasmodium ovale wallikeri]SBT73567.1 apicoplast calcium binding protein 1, putative [Plasmodium ovale]
MKLLQIPLARYDVVLFRFFLLICVLILIIISESFIKKKEFPFSAELPSKRNICLLIHNNIAVLENVLPCTPLLYSDIFPNDWKSLKKINDEKIAHKKKRRVEKYDEYSSSPYITVENHFNLTFDTNNPALDRNILRKSKVIFMKLDKNNNNYIDFNEFKKNVKILSKVEHISKDILIYIFNLFDTDDDKKLSYTEFLSLNSYDFGYVKLMQVLFDNDTNDDTDHFNGNENEEDNSVDKDIIFNYLEIYFSEFLENIISEQKYFFVEKHNLIHYLCRNFFQNNKNDWDLNRDEKLQIDEFQNFQLSLFSELFHLTNFLQLDFNLDGKIDLPELLLHINNDQNMYNKLRTYMANVNQKVHKKGNNNLPKNENLFNYMKEHLHIDNSLLLNFKFLLQSFDINNDFALDFTEYKNQVQTFSALEATPEIVFHN